MQIINMREPRLRTVFLCVPEDFFCSDNNAFYHLIAFTRSLYRNKILNTTTQTIASESSKQNDYTSPKEKHKDATIKTKFCLKCKKKNATKSQNITFNPNKNTRPSSSSSSKVSKDKNETNHAQRMQQIQKRIPKIIYSTTLRH